jgi:hypothetical protein
VNQYSSLVMSHVRRHPAYLGAGEDDSFWLNRTFQRFARAVGPDRLDLFPNLATVLGYLKMCAHSVLLDEARARRRHAHVSLEQVADCAESGTDLEGSVIQRMAAQELWEAVMQALPEESDRLIARLSFKHGCKPGKIQARYRDRFPSVADVYRAKRNVLDRLRRNPQVRRFLA